MASVLTPPILDSTGSEIVEKLQTLKQNIHASSADKEIIYNGVYPDYSNLIHSFTIPDGGGYVGWTATQECFAVISNAYTGLGNSMSIKINDVVVVSCYTDMTNVSSALLGHFASFYLKKGDVFEVSIPTNMAGADSSAKFYGLRKGTIEREITVDGLLAPTPAIYSSDEQQVGIWTDGKPLYQKVVNYGALPNASGSVNKAHNIANVDNIFIAGGYFVETSGSDKYYYPLVLASGSNDYNIYTRVDETNVRVSVNTDRSSMTAIVVVQYTKTTDTAWESGGFKAYGFTPVIYSETEREIGVWRDGKPLYQKTINFGSLPNTNVKYVDHNISNVDKVIKLFGYTTNADKTSFLPLPYSAYTPAACIGINAPNKTQVQAFTGNDRSGFVESYIIIQYTKTTDIAGSGKYTTIGTPAIHYSTDEQIVGTWIDGKTLYQKTLVTQSSYTITTSGSWVTTDISVPNGFETVIKAEIVNNYLIGIIGVYVNQANGNVLISNIPKLGDITVPANTPITVQYTKTS